MTSSAGISFEKHFAQYKRRKEATMKKVMMMLSMILLISCNGHGENPALAMKGTQKAGQGTDTVTYPKTDIRVNKSYDPKGNIIRYDSTYTYFYKSPGLKGINPDTLFGSLEDPLRANYNMLLKKNMDSIFFNDTLMKYDFLNPDFFSKRFELNMQHFQDMFKQMDSLKSGMLRKDYPEGGMRKNSAGK
jgi:hypothetical protein